jgi:hypothetical protein
LNNESVFLRFLTTAGMLLFISHKDWHSALECTGLIAMNRYLTHRYAAISWEEAVRLAHIDRTPLQNISRTAQVELLHRTEVWAWWSDQQLTSAIGLPQQLQPQNLSPDAAQLIDEVWCSDSSSPTCGWRTLAQVSRILKRQVLSVGEFRGEFRPATWEWLAVEFCDKQEGGLHRFRSGHEGGYRCDVTIQVPDSFTLRL